jgi:hypothetical protein
MLPEGKVIKHVYDEHPKTEGYKSHKEGEDQ